MSGRKSQRKGRAGELELSALLQRHGFNVQPGRAVSYGEVPDLSGLPGIHIECKRVEKLNLTAALEQAAHDAERFHDGLPTVFWRKNRQSWTVTMPLESWLKLYTSFGEIQCSLENTSDRWENSAAEPKSSRI